jgi:Putative beta-barrel porin-2, OmpL-like. bbp2
VRGVAIPALFSRIASSLVLFGGLVTAASAQSSLADVLGRPAAPEGQPKSYLEEIMLFSYIENSYVANLGRTGRGDVNELRFYDHDAGYTFNAAELSVKKDASERYRVGWGVVVTGGVDSQKNHSLGVFRDRDDSGPFFRNTAKYDLAEAYASYLVPLGNGLTLKAGKWATLIGYEVYESPKNLNFSRSFLYTLGTPYFHTGLLATYPLTKWLSVTAGFTNGWDNADNNNGHLRPTGSFAFTLSDKLSATVSWLVGPEQDRSQMRGTGTDANRWVVDTTILYTGLERWTFALNFDFAGEQNDPLLVATRRDADSRWGGVAGYAAYDWTRTLRTALRVEYFSDPQGVRSTETVTPGANVELWEVTATLQYNVWKGLVGRLEYRHDQANRNAFSVRNIGGRGLAPTSDAQNTITLALYYSFF